MGPAHVQNLNGTNQDFESKADENTQHGTFIKLFVEWLHALAAEERLPHAKEEELHKANGKRVHELAMLVTTTPAPLPWMVWRKFQILECYMNYNGDGTAWRDNREIVMLAGIKADLARFGIGSEGE